MTLSRRNLLQGAALSAAQGQQPAATGRSAASTPRFVGIQMGPHSMLDEGIDRVLDRLQGECGINSLLVYSHTYYTADGIRRKRAANVLAQDHGVPARDLNTPATCPTSGSAITKNISATPSCAICRSIRAANMPITTSSPRCWSRSASAK